MSGSRGEGKDGRGVENEWRKREREKLRPCLVTRNSRDVILLILIFQLQQKSRGRLVVRTPRCGRGNGCSTHPLDIHFSPFNFDPIESRLIQDTQEIIIIHLRIFQLFLTKGRPKTN